MGLNIKNERVHALAREAARVTGKSQTGAIEAALVRLLAEYGADPEQSERERRADIIRGVSLSWNPVPGTGFLRGEDDLYDADTGLPA